MDDDNAYNILNIAQKDVANLDTDKLKKSDFFLFLFQGD